MKLVTTCRHLKCNKGPQLHTVVFFKGSQVKNVGKKLFNFVHNALNCTFFYILIINVINFFKCKMVTRKVIETLADK